MTIKLLSWVNDTFLSEEQFIIQTNNAIKDISKKPNNTYYKDWESNGKNIVYLRGISHPVMKKINELIYIIKTFSEDFSHYPHATMREVGLNDSLTAISLIIPNYTNDINEELIDLDQLYIDAWNAKTHTRFRINTDIDQTKVDIVNRFTKWVSQCQLI